MNIVDTHCHIHDSEFYDATDEREAVYSRAIDQGVTMICVATSEKSSFEAIEFAAKHTHTYAVIGVHPHDSQSGYAKIVELLKTQRKNIYGIGEIGLDYYYNNSPHAIQIQALEQQLQWAHDYDLPVSFHVRDAFDDFWPIFQNFTGIRGVLHSFTDTDTTLEKAISEGLYIGINGISTFARDKQDMFDMVPLEKMLLETDAPFLTPVPLRGKVNEPAFVRHVAEYHAARRGVELDDIARATSANAQTLFGIK